MPIFERAIGNGCEEVCWSFEPRREIYRCGTPEISRAELLRSVCPVTSPAELPAAFADLMRYDATLALGVLEDGVRLAGEAAGAGRDVASELSELDLVPALQSATAEIRVRAIGLLGKFGRNDVSGTEGRRTSAVRAARA